MSSSPFITAAGTDNYVSEVTVDNIKDAVNQFTQLDTIAGGGGFSSATAPGIGISPISTATVPSLVLKTFTASDPIVLTGTSNNINIGANPATIGTVQDITAGAGIAITGTSTVNPTISNDGVISIVPHPDGSVVVDNTDPQNPIVQAVVVGAGGGTVTSVSSSDATVLSVANPTTTPALTFTGVKRLIQGSGISLSPSIGTTSDARGDVTIASTSSGGTVTSVSSTTGAITVANPTSTPALTFNGVTRIIGSTGVTVSSTGPSGTGDVTITASGGGGGGGGGTVTSVSSANDYISVTQTSPAPVLTNRGVLSLQGTAPVKVAATINDGTADARGNVTLSLDPAFLSSIPTENTMPGYPVRFADVILEQAPTAITNRRFTLGSYVWHKVRYNNTSPNFAPTPQWATPDVRLSTIAPLYIGVNRFIDFSPTAQTDGFLEVVRSGLYLISYHFAIRNPGNDTVVQAALFVNDRSNSRWFEVAGTSTSFRQNGIGGGDSYTTPCSLTTIAQLGSGTNYVFGICVSNASGFNNICLGNSDGFTASTITSDQLKPVRAEITFLRLRS